MQYTNDMGLRLINDFIFRYVFGREENTRFLIDLVNAVMEDAGARIVRTLELKDPVSLRDSKWAKETVVDILATGEDGRQFDIEMQVHPHKGFVNRSLYYWANLYSDQLEKGEAYGIVRPVVCINFVDFLLFPETDENHHRFMISDVRKPERVLTEDLEIHFVEICKKPKRESSLAGWAEFLENAGLEGADMQVLFDSNALMKEAYVDFERCAQNEKLRLLARAREFYQRDVVSLLYTAEHEGLEKGMQQGMQQGIELAKLEDARRFKTLGVDLETIVEATGLTIETVEKL